MKSLPSSNNRSKKLSSYLSLTIGAGAATVINADAAIIAYNGAAVTVTNGGNYLYFDPINSTAGVSGSKQDNEFNIRYRAGTNYVYTAKLDSLSDMSWGITSSPVGSKRVVAKSAEGVTINSSTLWWNGTYSFFSYNGWTTAQSPWATGANNTRGFAAFKFSYDTAPADYFYGWADLTYNNGATHSLVLNNFAYENVANTAITTGAIPEPSSMLLLALGGAATLAVRRRKQKQTLEKAS